MPWREEVLRGSVGPLEKGRPTFFAENQQLFASPDRLRILGGK